MRILILIFLIAIILLFLKLILRVSLFLLFNPFSIKKLIEILLKSAPTNGNDENNSKMVKCTMCQLYIPKNKAYHYQGQFYCCEAHAKYQK